MVCEIFHIMGRGGRLSRGLEGRAVNCACMYSVRFTHVWYIYTYVCHPLDLFRCVHVIMFVCVCLAVEICVICFDYRTLSCPKHLLWTGTTRRRQVSN